MEKIKKINKQLEKLSGTWDFNLEKAKEMVQDIENLEEKYRFSIGDDEVLDGLGMAVDRLKEMIKYEEENPDWLLMFSLNFDIDLKLFDKNLNQKFAENIVEQYRQKLREENLDGNIRYELDGNIVNIFIEERTGKSKKIPYKIVNGRIVVPKEYQKYLSKDGKSLDIKEDSKFNKITNSINLNIFEE